jgi:hypothetical protein
VSGATLWHQALGATKGLCSRFRERGRGELEARNYLRKVSQWSSPTPKTCSGMMKYSVLYLSCAFSDRLQPHACAIVNHLT